MFDWTNYTFNYYGFPPLVVGILLAILGLVVLLWERASVPSVAFHLLSLVGAAWLLAYAGLCSARTEDLALWWAKAENVAVVFIPSCIFLFTLTIVQRLYRFRWLTIASFLLSTFFAVMIIFTNRFVAGIYEFPWGYYARYGPVGALFLLFFFSLTVISLRLYWLEYSRSPAGVRKQRLEALLLGFCTAYLGSIDFLPTYGIPVYPAGYLAVSAFLVITAQAIWRYRLVDITPAFAAQQILEIMEGAAIIVDLDGCIRIANRAAYELLDYPEAKILSLNIDEVIESSLEMEPVLTHVIRQGTVRDQVMIWKTRDGRSIDVNVSASILRDKSNTIVGVVYVAVDISRYR